MRIDRFDAVVFSFLRHDDHVFVQQFSSLAAAEHAVHRIMAFLPYPVFQREISSVMDKPEIVAVKMLPAPVQSREFAIQRILLTDIVSGIIPGKAVVFFSLRSDKHRQIHRISRYITFLMACDHDFNIHIIQLHPALIPR